MLHGAVQRRSPRSRTATTQANTATNTISGAPRHGSQRAAATPSRPPPSTQSGITASSAGLCTPVGAPPECPTSQTTTATPAAAAVGPRTPRQVASVRACSVVGVAASCDSTWARRALDAIRFAVKNVAGPSQSSPSSRTKSGTASFAESPESTA